MNKQRVHATTKEPTRYYILSPDGLPIAHKPFASRSEAAAFIPEWCRRYQAQGYYSSPRGRITLEDLPAHLVICSETDLTKDITPEGRTTKSLERKGPALEPE